MLWAFIRILVVSYAVGFLLGLVLFYVHILAS